MHLDEVPFTTNSQQSVFAADVIALMDALKIAKATIGGFVCVS
jgi:hypothetical protein